MRHIETPRDMPWALRALVDAMDAGADATDELVASADNGAQLRADADHVRRYVAGLRAADLYWVTPDMTAVALDAARDMPDWSALAALPAPSGLLLWRGGLPAVVAAGWPARQGMATVPLRGVVWIPVDGRLLVVMLTDVERGAAPLWPFDEFYLPLTGPAVPTSSHRLHPDALGVTALVGATWTMMQEPTVSIGRPVRPGRRDMEMAVRMGLSRPLITSVSLRPMRTVRTGGAPDGTRRLKVRHVVRGHWRQQYHPSDGSHRPKWIASYIKGPDGAPLRLTRPVMVWRR